MKISEKIHFIGIGGIGVSAVAKLLLEMGKKVSGSDLIDTEITDKLRQKGAEIFIGRHNADNVSRETELIVYSNAVTSVNVELKKSKKMKIQALSYPEFLGKMMEHFLPIIVSGTHGKSTITAMLAGIFKEAKLYPTVVVGTKMENDDNAILGLGRYFIAEGDEYKEAFLNYNPAGLIINNIEEDHLDYYKNFDNIKKAFKKLISRVPKGGILVANNDDPNIKKIVSRARCRVITYGIESGDYYATHIMQHGEILRFSVKGLEKFDLALRIPGQHNVYNALAACVMSIAFGIPLATIRNGLFNFKGIWRRLQITHQDKKFTLIDDYAHHPTEIKAALQAVKSYYPGRKIWCIFQPHSRNRTKKLLKQFGPAFKGCDKLILTDIFDVAGRDKNEKISIIDLSREIKKYETVVKVLKRFNAVKEYINLNASSNDVVITMGAGTITKLNQMLK
ncbi:MAG: UDP-N-acetylmuramate--L-alanine ligase [Patescibacteria group bacterium]|jgi:UDP-N-acetylmuramate--alanine ligase